MKRTGLINFIVIMTFIGFGCSKSFLDEEPLYLISSDNLYHSYSGFQAGVNGLYNEARRERAGVTNPSNACANQIMLGGTDMMYSNYSGAYDNLLREWGNLNQPQQSFYKSTWEWLYGMINAANIIVLRAANTDVEWTVAQKNEIIAQARFFRAWAYRHLTNLWGDVPLNLEEASGIYIHDWERAPVEEVWEQMEADLLFAEANLDLYPRNDGRLAKGAATHYLAELYLTMGLYDLAIDKAKELIGSGVYALIENRYGKYAAEPGVVFMDMFRDGNSNRSEGNTETLWTFQYEYNVKGGDGPNIMRRTYLNAYANIVLNGKAPLLIDFEYGGRGLGRQSPTRFMLQLYEPADDRGSEFAWRWYYQINNPQGIPNGYVLGDTITLDTISAERVNNAFCPSTRKWDDGTPADNLLSNSTFNDQMYLRLAETYLILAEAQFKSGKTADAASNLNILRRRAHASEIDETSVTIDFILDERARELFCEEHRRYVLLRNHKWLERTRLHNSLTGPNIVERDTLLPIPQSVIDANLTIKMSQNPGY